MARSLRAALVLILVTLVWPAAALAQTPPAGSTRLFFGPTGRMLPPGQVYVAGYGVLIPTFQAGVTERFSIGGGVMPLALVFGGGPMPFWVTPKFQVYSSQRTSVAAGVMQGIAAGEGSMGIAYLVSTSGSETASYTVGALLAYARDDDGGGVAPLFQIGGERRINRRVVVVTENYVSPHGVGMLSAGVRLERQKLSVDLGLATAFGLGDFVYPGLLVNWTWRF